MNNVAQLIECAHVVMDSIGIIEELLGSDWDQARQPVTPKEGEGIAAVEVPRGILYHSYIFDSDGRIQKA